ncbi:MAG TPA: hypothetical protein VF881_17265 [Polyangiaceae bacterium]
MACLVLSIVALAARARAEQEPIDLSYRVYEGCPSEKQFLAQVVGRAAKTLVATERARGRKFVVTVTGQRRETLGRLEILSGSDVASREVTGANCAEVISALALFTALAIDPGASTEPSAELLAREKSAAAGRSPGASPPALTSPAPTPGPESRREPETGGSIDRTLVGERAEWLAGARAGGAGAFTGGSAVPGTAWGGGIFVQWTTPGFGAYRASGAYFAKNETGDATFQWIAARLDGCPVRAPLARGLVLEPCVAFELGRVTATAKSSPAIDTTTERRWWAAADALGRLRYRPSPWFFLELEGGLVVPFTRYVFVLGTETDPQREVHRVPAAGWVVDLGLGVRFL